MFKHGTLLLRGKPPGLRRPFTLCNAVPLHKRTSLCLLPGVRMKHTIFSREVYQPLPFSNRGELRDYIITKEMKARTINIYGPKFAIEQDYRRLLEDHGLNPGMILSTYRWNGFIRSHTVYAVMPTVEDVARAVVKVQGALLFDTKVRVRLPYPDEGLFSKVPQIEWGWYATNGPGIENIRLRAPLLSPPVDIFRPIKEGAFCLRCESK